MSQSPLAVFLLLLGASGVAAWVSSAPGDRKLAALIWLPALASGLASLLFFFGVYFTNTSPGWVGLWPAAAAATLVFRLGGGRLAVTGAAARDTTIGPTWTHWVLLVAVGLTAHQFWFISYHQPHGSWDAGAVWNMLARHLARSDDVPATLAPMLHGHPDYPLLLPGSLAWLFRTTGEESLVFIHGMALMFSVGLALTLYVVMARFVSRAVAAAACAVLLLTPTVISHGAWQTADIPLAYLTLLVASGLATLSRPGRPMVNPTLVGFCWGCLPWLKHEGAILAAILLGVVVALRLVRARAGFVDTLLRFALGAAIPITAIVLHRRYWAPANDLVEMGILHNLNNLTDRSRWALILEALRSSLTGGDPAFWNATPLRDRERWGVAWMALAAVALVVGRWSNLRRRPEIAYFMVLLPLAFAAWIVVFLMTPIPLQDHLDMAFDRLMLQIYPLAIVASLGLIGREAAPIAPSRPDRRHADPAT
ncbi:MAG: hypothetical protein KDB53_21695 [Planctomycetes bacterium]|nr:hypothetical protein [Planctomycetota bacterium]